MMKWLGKIKWKTVVTRLGIMAALFLLYAVATLPMLSDYSLQIRLRQDRTGNNTQLYWWDTGEKFTQEQSYQTAIYVNQIVIPFQKGMVGWNREWRLDIIDANLDVGITSFDLYKNSERRKNFSADELEEYALKAEGVENVYSTGEDYYIRPLGDDPSINFGTNLSRSIVRHIALHYLKDLAAAGVVIFILAIGDKLPGLNRFYRLVRKNIRRIGIILLLLIPCGVVLFPDYADYSLQIGLGQDRTGNNTQLYWWDEGEEYIHEQSYQTAIYGSKIVLPFQKGMLGLNREWRLDIIDADKDVELVSFELYRGQEAVRAFSMEELESCIIKNEGVEEAYRTEGGYYINPSDMDPSMGFGVRLSRLIMEDVIRDFLVKLMAAGLVVFILGIGDKLPGLRYLYALVRKHVRRIGIMGALLIPCAAALMPQYTDYSLRIEFAQDRTGYNTQLYWWDVGESFTQKQSFLVLIDGRQVQIPFRGDMLSWNKEWRLDIIDADLDVEITGFQLYRGQDLVRSYSGDEIEGFIIKNEGVAEAYSTGEGYYVRPLKKDPSMSFGIRLPRAIIEHIVKAFLLKLAVAAIPVFLVVFADRLPGLRRVYARLWDCRSSNKAAFLCHCLLLGGIIFFLFHDFILGDKVFLYLGDSFYQTYAQLTHVADRIAAGEWGWGYTFYESLGNGEEPILLSLKNLPALFGREHLAYAMGLAHMLKVFLAGIFFYCYLRQMGTGKLGSSLLGMGYACNAYIIARGMWQNYPNEAVCFALWLWGFELFRNSRGRQRWLPFFLINAFCYWHYNGYSAVLYTGVSLVYAVFRYLSDKKEGEEGRPLWKELLKLGGCIAGGAAASAAVWLPSLQEMLGSSRVSEGAVVAGNWKNILNYTRLPAYRSMFYRLIGADILGMHDDAYVGAANWLEDPVYYCGLIAVVTVPLGYYAMKKEKKRWYLLPIVGMVLYNSFGIIRNLANGFAGIGWKLSSLWVIVLLLIIAASIWQDPERAEAGEVKKLLIITNGVLLILSAVLYTQGIRLIYLAAGLGGCMFLSLLLYLLWSAKDEGRKAYFKYLLLVGTAIEVVGSSYRVVNNRTVLSAQVLEDDIFYNDATTELLAAAEDGDGFYRVDKQFISASYCDSLYQRYKGTASYIGGVGDNEYTQKLYESLGLPVLQHVQRGTAQNTAINALCNVRYVLTKNQELNTYGLEYLSEKDGIKLYENEYALPFGYVYDEYMAESEFMEYPSLDRQKIMLEQCIIADAEAGMLEGSVPEGEDYVGFEEQWGKYRETVRINDERILFKHIEEGEIGVFRIRTSAKELAWAEAYYMQGTAMKGKADLLLVNGEKDYFLECMIAGTNNVLLHANTSKPYEISEIDLYVIPVEEYFANYREQMKERQQGGFLLTDFQEEQIGGRAEMEKGGIMVFTIPYDKDWRAYVDGKETRLLHANVGFMGLCLEAGSHDIVLSYR